MLDSLTAWWRRRRSRPANPPEAAAPDPQPPAYGRWYFEAADGSPASSAATAARRIGHRELPGGELERETAELAPPEWVSCRTREQPAAEPYAYRRTHYFPWGQERRRVALSQDAAGQPVVDYHEYFPTGELRRHRQLTAAGLTTRYAFREPAEGEEYVYIEQMPQFPGGMEQLMQDINRFMKYPPAALREGLEGRVPLKFTVAPTGLMCDIEANAAVHPVLADAAVEMLRQVAAIRRWQPGMQNRRVVPVVYTVPVTFSLR